MTARRPVLDVVASESVRSDSPHRLVEALVRNVRTAQREEWDLRVRPVIALARAGNEHAIAAVVILHSRRIRATAVRLHPPASGLDDLVSEGLVALLGALGRYDPSRGVPLWGFAHKGVRGQMIAAFGASVGLTPYQTRAYPAVWRAVDALVADQPGRTPAPTDVAQFLRDAGRRRIGLETVAAVMERGRRRPDMPLGHRDPAARPDGE